jgi:hypothetical protein
MKCVSCREIKLVCEYPEPSVVDVKQLSTCLECAIREAEKGIKEPGNISLLKNSLAALNNAALTEVLVLFC